MSSPSVRVLFVSIGQDADALAAAVEASALKTHVDAVESTHEAVDAIQNGRIDVCFAPSTVGPDTSASLTLALARVGAYVPVIAVVDEASAGFEAIADEGAADFVWRGDLSPQSVSRALLVAHARAEAVSRFQSVQADRDAVLAATGSVAVTLDGEGLVTDLRASAAFQSDFGEAAPGARFASLFSSDARAAAVQALRHAHEGRIGRFRQLRARAGRPLTLAWTLAQSANGFRAVGVDRSETSREAYRADLYHAVLETILEQTPTSAFVVDTDGSFLFTMGKELEGLRLRGITLDEAFRDQPGILGNVKRARVGASFTDRHTLRDGRQVEAHYTPCTTGSQDAIGVLCVLTDISEPVLRSTEQSRLDVVLALASEVVLLVDPVGMPVYLSPALREVVGCTARELQEEGGVSRLFSDPRQRAIIARSVRAGDPWCGETGLRTADGGTALYTLEARPVFDREGTRIGSVARLTPA